MILMYLGMSVAKSSEKHTQRKDSKKITNQLQIRVKRNSREVMKNSGSQQKTAKEKYTSKCICEAPFHLI